MLAKRVQFQHPRDIFLGEIQMFKSRSNFSKAKRRKESSESSGEDTDHRGSVTRISEPIPKQQRHGVSATLAPSEIRNRDATQEDSKIKRNDILSGEDALRILESDREAGVDFERSRDSQRKLSGGLRAYVEPADEVNAKQTIGLGPQKTAANVRSTSRFDYQMDICKDYKESGYCGFGDSCKFLHDRSDYKSGWQLESEWNSQQRQLEKERFEKFQRKRHKLQQLREDAVRQGLDPDTIYATDSDTEISEKDKCSVCGNKWSDCSTSPCTSICGHYFCESCFADTSTSICRVCGKPTQGIFNSIVLH